MRLLGCRPWWILTALLVGLLAAAQGVRDYGLELGQTLHLVQDAAAIRAAVERAGVAPEQVDEVIMGCVLPGGLKQGPARQAMRQAGLPDEVGATTINKLCGSGMKAAMFAHDLIRAGTIDIAVAGGMESMSNAPYVLDRARAGYRMGHAGVYDHMFLDGLEDAETGRLMGSFAQEVADEKGISRGAMDDFALESLRRANQAIEAGAFGDEIVAFTVKTRKGEQVVPIIIHGDAAFAGQGVVMETFNMSQSRGFSTKGTVHVVVNNQIGFTTSHQGDARSTLYCTDIAKMVNAPIFHVNGDDPDAVIQVTRLALDYRMNFHKDVVIDLVCYRRHGHSEADEPTATQPLMYQAIRDHSTTRELYAQRLVEEGVIDPKLPQQLLATVTGHIKQRLVHVHNAVFSIGNHDPFSRVFKNALGDTCQILVALLFGHIGGNSA